MEKGVLLHDGVHRGSPPLQSQAVDPGLDHWGLRVSQRRLAVAAHRSATDALGVRAVLVVAGGTFHHEEHEQDNPADERDEPGQDEGTRLAGVVKTPDTARERRDERAEDQ